MLIAEGLSKNYGEKIGLHPLDLHIKKGEIFAMLGQNGAGKTTTINLFLGFIEPSSGVAKLNGKIVHEDSVIVKQDLAYIPETVMLYPNLSGLENLKYFTSLTDYDYSEKELVGFLEEVGLQDHAYHRRVEGYSKGMRQKVGIAIAIAKKAKALLLDEPTSGLDPKASNEFSQIISKLATNGAAILMATHDIFRAKEVATRIGIMKEGRIKSLVNADEITANELEDLYIQTV